MASQRSENSESTPLLQNGHADRGSNKIKVEFDKDGDDGNPREWPTNRKFLQVAQIFFVALICPMGSSIFAPALDKISQTFDCSQQLVLLGQTGFMVGLGIGPLFLAPMSETFGRRILFVGCLAIYTLLQIPTAVAPNVAVFVTSRTLSGFFGSVGVANGGGSIFDMFETHERAKVLGVYLVAPLFGPTLGPLVGGLIVGSLHWRWIFYLYVVLSAILSTIAYFFLYETNATIILSKRRDEKQKKHPQQSYEVEGVSNQSIPQKISQNSTRAIRILTTQPIVAVLSLYQALVFASLYSIYAQYQTIWSSPPYNFDKTQVGLAYLGPAVGFVLMAIVMVVFIDKVYNYFSKLNEDEGQPEYRLPLANIAAVFLPASLFWFGWSIEKGMNWTIPIIATVSFGASQVSVFNPLQTYYIDAYGSSAASALAAGAFLRSIIGGVVPLFVSDLFDALGYGWGMSVFGILSIILVPAPWLFQNYGKRLRERFPFEP